MLPPTSRVRWLYDELLRYALMFGAVGLIGFVIDVGIFNLLRLGLFGEGHVFADPFGAKITSVTIAIIATWFGNRYWTFREHRRPHAASELLEFATIAVAGMGISLLCLWISREMLGHTSLLADNIAANGVGLALGTAFRFLLYRYWVFAPARKGSVDPALHLPVPEGTSLPEALEGS